MGNPPESENQDDKEERSLLKFRNLISEEKKDLVKFRDLIFSKEKTQAEPPVEEEKISLQAIIPPTSKEDMAEKGEPVDLEAEGAEDKIEIKKMVIEGEPRTLFSAEEEIRHLHEEGVAVVEKLVHQPNGQAGEIINTGHSVIEGLVKLLEQGHSLYDKIPEFKPSVQDYIPRHCANVAILSLDIAQGLDYNSEELIDVGLCALVHDVGMSLVNTDILSKRGPLNDKEFQEVKKHPLYGNEFMEKLNIKSSMLQTVILQEHEREDGSGYPYGLKGKEIHEYAKIVGLADVFEALKSGRVYREGFTQFHTVREILHWGKKLFHQRLLRALLKRFTLFPVNSYVRLNNKAIGKVISVNMDYPMRPVVKIIYDEKGRKITQEQVLELQKEPLLHILEALGGEQALSSRT